MLGERETEGGKVSVRRYVLNERDGGFAAYPHGCASTFRIEG
jgi:hypothetical protein